MIHDRSQDWCMCGHVRERHGVGPAWATGCYISDCDCEAYKDADYEERYSDNYGCSDHFMREAQRYK